MDLKLKDKVAVITGGGNGIGRAAALKFAEEGAIPVICDIEMDCAEGVVEEISETGGSAYAYNVDVTEADQIDNMVTDVISRLGRIDILVNNAGIASSSAVEDMTEEEWDKVIDISLKGTFLFSRAVAKPMIDKRYGKIVNISSCDRTHSFTSAKSVHYCAAKAGITGFTRQLALEVAEYGINVNCVAPGHTKVERYVKRVENLMDRTWEEHERIMFSKIPLREFADPEDQANAIVFLSSDVARHITGATLDVNGGLLMV